MFKEFCIVLTHIISALVLMLYIACFATSIAVLFIPEVHLHGQTKPVYRLEAKDVKTATAKMLLKGFEVRDQVVYVTLGI